MSLTQSDLHSVKLITRKSFSENFDNLLTREDLFFKVNEVIKIIRTIRKERQKANREFCKKYNK